MGLRGIIHRCRRLFHLRGFRFKGIGLVAQFFQQLFARGDFALYRLRPFAQCTVFVIIAGFQCGVHLRRNLGVFVFERCKGGFVHFARCTYLPKPGADFLLRCRNTGVCTLQVVQFVDKGDHSLFFTLQFGTRGVCLFNQCVLRCTGFNRIDFGIQFGNGVFQFIDDTLLNVYGFNDFLRCLVHRITAANNGIGKALDAAQRFLYCRVHISVVHNGRKGQCAPVYISHIFILKNLRNSKSVLDCSPSIRFRSPRHPYHRTMAHQSSCVEQLTMPRHEASNRKSNRNAHISHPGDHAGN